MNWWFLLSRGGEENLFEPLVAVSHFSGVALPFPGFPIEKTPCQKNRKKQGSMCYTIGSRGREKREPHVLPFLARGLLCWLLLVCKQLQEIPKKSLSLIFNRIKIEVGGKRGITPAFPALVKSCFSG